MAVAPRPVTAQFQPTHALPDAELQAMSNPPAPRGGQREAGKVAAAVADNRI